MKKIKISYMGKHLKDIYPHATKFQVFRYKFNKVMEKAFLVAFVSGAVYGGFQLGKYSTEPVTVFADKEVIKEVRIKSPVMERIAKCESGGTHTKNGKVVFNRNNNGSTDIGKYQINTIWLPKASELKFDLTNEKDNEEFAYWLYDNTGTEHWYSSKACWNR